ncbi:YdaU family protein [Hymenobacter profundi]|uniref:YdaU family protein n=2 Tax=Hymenobacter profundi TaxID=1982110 RepID=A0ABS6WUQ6_9BACT|nr:YdaU family protein [Hymenobacter profundi]
MKAPAFLFYTGDFLSSPDVQLMEAHEVGAYCLLLFNSWQSDRPGFLPDDENRLRRIARLSQPQWADSRELLLSKFPLDPADPTHRYNPRLVQEAIKQTTKRERLAANGRKGGRPANQLLSLENQLVSENPPAALAASPENQLLSTDKQKLSGKKQLPPKDKAIEKAFNFSFTTSNEVEGGAPAPKLSKVKKPLPRPTPAEVQAYAAEQYPDNAEAQTEAVSFCDHYDSNGWRVSGKTLMADWRAAFRNWMRRRPQFQATGSAKLAATPARARTAPKPTDPSRWS